MYERKSKSKVLTIYTLEKEANEIDLQMYHSEFKKFQYLSYKYSTSTQKMAAMNSNELLNVKARFKILYNTKLEDKVYKDGKETILEKLIMSQKE